MATEWYEKAAAQGNTTSMAILGKNDVAKGGVAFSYQGMRLSAAKQIPTEYAKRILLMKKIAVLIFFAINSAYLSAQINITIEGTVINNSETGFWEGINIQRSIPTSLIFRNNSVTSVNTSGYMLQAGDEGIYNTNNKLDGEIISGNKFTWSGTDMTSITHGLFTGHNRDVIIEYNYLNEVPMAIIRKSANNMSNGSGVIAYNIIINPSTGIVIKGMSDVNVFNNTFYQARTYAETGRGLVDVYINTDVTPNSPAHGTKIKNNIFYSKFYHA